MKPNLENFEGLEFWITTSTDTPVTTEVLVWITWTSGTEVIPVDQVYATAHLIPGEPQTPARPQWMGIGLPLSMALSLGLFLVCAIVLWSRSRRRRCTCCGMIHSNNVQCPASMREIYHAYLEKENER